MSDTHEITDVALAASGSDGSVEVEESSLGCEKEEDEWARIQRIEKPWLFETRHPMTEPPDVNYRNIIIYDQDCIDLLLEDEDLHFTERCLQYREQDVDLEWDVLFEYTGWTNCMLDAAKASGDNTREEFFQGLLEVVTEDEDMVWSEWSKLIIEQGERARQRAGQRLGIPADHEEWTSEDRRRFVEDDEYVVGWPNNDRRRHRAARRLGIPENHEEWTSEDRRRFGEDDEYVVGWPSDDRQRHRAAQRLGIPESHEEWTTEDKRRYVDSDERVVELPTQWEVGESLEEMDEANSATPSQNTESEQIENGNQPPSENEDGERSLPLCDMDNELSSPSHAPTSTLPLPEQETETSSAADSKRGPLDNDSHSSLPLNIELRPQWRTLHYHTIASLLLTLLFYEMVKQKLRL